MSLVNRPGGPSSALQSPTRAATAHKSQTSSPSTRQTATRKPGAATQSVRGARRIIARELAPFARQLAAMLHAGMSLIASITTIEEQTTNPSFRKVLSELRKTIEGGSPFSDGLATFPTVFDDLFVSIVRAGERSGEFAVSMRYVGTLLENNAKLSRKVRSALAYPVVVGCVAIIIAFGLITFVVPVFAKMFADFDAKLPLPTLVLVSLSVFMKKYVLLIIGAVALGIFLFRRWKATEAGAYTFDRFALKAPVFGTLMQKVAIARFTRIFALMVKSGVPILDGLDVVSKACGNKVIGRAIMQARGSVEQGEPLAKGLEGKACLPPLMVRMMAAGEKSGQIDAMCENIADTYDDEVNNMLATLTSLLEPILMVFLGVMIGSIVVSLFLPIFKMVEVVGNK
jgi:type IV pilus assembly protein PilC